MPRRRKTPAFRGGGADSVYLRALIECNPLAIVVLRVDGSIVDCNKAFEELFGYSREEVLLRTLDDLIVAEAEREEAHELTDRARAGEQVHAEVRRLHKLGHYVEVAMHGVEVSVDGDHAGVFAIYEDISKRKRAQEALQQSERRSRTLFEHVPDPIFIFDKASNVFLDCNSAVGRVYGYTRDDLRSMTPYDLHPPEDYMKVHENIAVANVDAPNTYVHLTKDGRKMDVEILSDDIVWEGRLAWISIVRDISERKRGEADLRAAKAAAEEATVAKSVFLANMSHEIRTPMNAIMGMTDLTLDTELDREQREYLQTVRDASESLLSLIGDILDFSKIEAGKLELESLDFGVRDCVENAVKTLAVRAQEKGIEIAIDVAADVPHGVVGDPVRLRQIVVNLVGNAIKFTESGEIEVSVCLEALDDTQVALHFAVRDTGVGIPEDKLSTIFESFSQADASTTRQFGGTGLGLAISSQLAERMGGRMWVESEFGVGTTFHFIVRFGVSTGPVEPLRDGATPGRSTFSMLVGDDIDTNRRQVPRPLRSPQPSLRVLVAEDNPVNVKLATRLLEKRGHHVSVAGNGQEALDLIAGQEPFDVVLMDVQMPVMDGFEATAAIRAAESGDRLRIVGVTAHAMAGDKQRCLDAGMDGYLSKPFVAKDLFALIED